MVEYSKKEELPDGMIENLIRMIVKDIEIVYVGYLDGKGYEFDVTYPGYKKYAYIIDEFKEKTEAKNEH